MTGVVIDLYIDHNAGPNNKKGYDEIQFLTHLLLLIPALLLLAVPRGKSSFIVAPDHSNVIVDVNNGMGM